MITSLNNRTVKEIAALSRKGKERNKRDVFVVEGVKMFMEAPAECIRGIYIARSAEREILERCGEKLADLTYELVSDEVFAKMSDTMTPQGILCLVRQFHYKLEEILRKRIKEHVLFIVLEDIQDPGNLGTIFRTAEAAGADGVIMSRQTVDVYNPKTIRSTMGSIYRVPYLYAEDISSIIKKLREQGVNVYAAHLKGTDYDTGQDYRENTAFLIGNEAKGLREETAVCADALIRIPMEGQVESLNAAVASSVLLYEAHRQRKIALNQGLTSE